MWKVLGEVREEDPSVDIAGQNVAGIVVFLDNGKDKHEVARVAYTRRIGKNSRVGFKRQYNLEVEKAQLCKELLNKPADLRSKWRIKYDIKDENPRNANDPKNTGGLAIYIVGGGEERLHSVVGFVRRNTDRPRTSFKKALAQAVDQVELAVNRLNDSQATADEVLAGATGGRA